MRPSVDLVNGFSSSCHRGHSTRHQENFEGEEQFGLAAARMHTSSNWRSEHGALWGLSLLGFAAAAYLVDMIRQRASSGEILPRLGLAGMLVYGMMIPVNLYWKLAKAAGQNLLDSPDCRGRYGFLYDRFKPGKWGGRIPDPQPKDHAALRHNPFG